MPRLESLLELVKGRVPLLLEIKVDGDLWRWMPALKSALRDYRGRHGVMSFDPRIGRLLKTRFPRVRRGLVIRDSWSPPRRLMALALADPDFLAVDRSAIDKSWVAGQQRKGRPVYCWTIRGPQQRVASASSCGRPYLGSPMADRETEVVAKLSSGVSGLNSAAWDRLAGSDPFVSHAFLSALEASGSVGEGTGWTPATLLGRGRRFASGFGRARLSEDAQPGRICFRPRLGRRIRARGWYLLSQAPDRRAVHAGPRSALAWQSAATSARGGRSGRHPERNFLSAHHLHR